jgi:hypothetical protein
MMLEGLPQALRNRMAGMPAWLEVRTTEIFLATASAAYLFPLVFGNIYDRYVIGVLPSLVLLLIAAALRQGDTTPARSNRLSYVLPVVLLAGLSWFTVAGTRDLVTWNAKRFELLDGLMAQGVSPTEIDGGFAFNGAHNYGYGQYVGGAQRSPWWVVDDRYIIAFDHRPGYFVRVRGTYWRWLTFREDAVLLLERKGNAGVSKETP